MVFKLTGEVWNLEICEVHWERGGSMVGIYCVFAGEGALA